MAGFDQFKIATVTNTNNLLSSCCLSIEPAKRTGKRFRVISTSSTRNRMPWAVFFWTGAVIVQYGSLKTDPP